MKRFGFSESKGKIEKNVGCFQMGVLELIIDMKNQGISEKEISDTLREQGVPPKEIRDALNQSQIKSAISGQEDFVESELEAPRRSSPNYPLTRDVENLYTPSPGYSYTPNPEYNYPPRPQETREQKTYAPEYYQTPEQESYSQEYYPQEYYPESPQEGYSYEPGEGVSSGTLVEIAEQVFSEKIKKIQSQIESLNEFKVLAETKINSFSDRLKRIEEMIDKLQAAILEKIGSYGRNLDGIKKEMSMMQDSFSKVINPILDKTHGVSGHLSHKKSHKKK